MADTVAVMVGAHMVEEVVGSEGAEDSLEVDRVAI